MTARYWKHLGQFFSSPGVFTEVIHVFLARGLSPCDSVPETHEVLEARWVPMVEATSLAAKHMGWADRIGSLQPGRFGDLIAVKGDPLADVTRLQDVAVVIKGGLAFKLPAE